MNYQEKYLKYKAKYLSLQQKGGAGVINIGVKQLSSELTLLFFDNNSFRANGIQSSINESIIEGQTKNINSDLIIRQDKNLVSNFNIFNLKSFNPEYCLEIINKSRLIITNEYKLFILENNNSEYNYKVYILALLDDLNKTNFIDNIPGKNSIIIIEIKEGLLNYRFEGTIIFNGKDENNMRNNKINLTLFTENNITTKINIQNKSIEDLIYYKFDMQEYYDNFVKPKKICYQSSILYKHIYNSYLTKIYLENQDTFIIVKTFGKIIEKKLENEIDLIKDNIEKICSSNEHRFELLKNVMKRIKTSYQDNIEIKNSQNNWIKINDINLNNDKTTIIFDTGNSTITMIGSDIIQALGLRTQNSFNLNIAGITKEGIKSNKIVEIELKLVDSDYNIGKTFKIIGYEDIINKNKILLGQSSEDLKQFFRNSYCIGYDTSANDYKDIFKLYLQQFNKYKNILEEFIKITNQIIFNKFNKIEIDAFSYNVLLKLINIKVKLSKIISMFTNTKYIQEITKLYQNCLLLKQNIRTINESGNKLNVESEKYLNEYLIGNNII